ncbi:MAG TPA: hypothetical protein PKU97_24580, partial [Kofleriaceae bacterium]|nr:hypothetical protein [Kofleriaceae bacterium]
MLALLVLVVSVVSIVGPGVRPASADVTGELYQDAKAVIEDLLSAEITRALVPQIVCRAGRQEELATPSDCTQTLGEADPAAVCLRIGPRFQVVRLRLLQYFPATLQALYSRRFAALRSTVAHEVVDVASDTFYRALREDLAHLQKQLTAAHNPGVRLALEYANEIAPPADTVLTPLGPAALASCVTQVRARFGHGFTTAVSALDAACTPSSGDNALECELSLAMRAALRGQVPQSQARLRRALALWLAHGMLARLPLSTASTRALVKPLGDELTSLLVTQENAPADPQAFATFARRSAALLEQHCATTVAARSASRAVSSGLTGL